MIGKITGTVEKVDIGLLIVNVGGIGYKIFTPVTILDNAKESADISLWTHLAVRETALDLYGFETEEELRFFELLLTISGIGPKSALGILNVASPRTLRQAIQSGDTSHLTKVSGIGKKSAQKIVLELKDKLGADTEEDLGALQTDVDVVEALQALGYSQSQARGVLETIPSDITDTSERVKAALKELSK